MTQQFKGISFDEFHKTRMSTATGFANSKGTNFDHFIYGKDSIDWQWLIELQEQDLAHSLDYAHGLELDDFGDDVGQPRNGLDDAKYRFILKSKRLVKLSKGTFGDLSAIAANLLGCDPTDVKLSNDRHYDDNGNLVGEQNTINIDSINYDKVNSMELAYMLPNELQQAALATVRVNSIGFYEKTDATIRTATAIAITEYVSIN